MAKLKQLLKDMEQRLAILQEESNKKWRNEVIEARISEITLAIVAIQQILISDTEMSNERRNELKKLYPDTLTLEECNRKMLINILTAQLV